MSASAHPATTTAAGGNPPRDWRDGLDPLPVLTGLAGLRRLTGTYPAGHPMISQKVCELYDAVQRHLRVSPALRIEVIHGDVFLDGVSCGRDRRGTGQIVRELSVLGIDSIHIHEGVEPDELRSVAEFLWQLKDDPRSEPISEQLARLRVSHVSLGTLVPLDTRWRAREWPDAPTGPLDPAYAESLRLAEQAFETVTAGGSLEVVTVRDLVKLLIYKVARSSAALGQILAVKQYENLTYCHSVNVAILSLLLGRQLGLAERAAAALVEAALLHDIGKTRIPLGVLKKPGALDARERRLMESHTILGAEILIQITELGPLTPIVALEHHRSVKGEGYPDIGDGAAPHALSQIVSVADIYEAMTGARSYQSPSLPERACLVLARLAGDKLNTALVKAFVNAVTFFPLGSLIRTTQGDIGVVVRTNPSDPLHPSIALLDVAFNGPHGHLDLSERDASGVYIRHVMETLIPPVPEFDVGRFLPRS